MKKKSEQDPSTPSRTLRTRPLTLRRETLRTLSLPQLERIGGGEDECSHPTSATSYPVD